MSPKLDLEFLPILLTWGWGMKRTGEPAHGAVSTFGHSDSSGQLQWLVVVHTHPQIPADDSCPVAVSHSPLSLIQSEWQLWLLLHQPLPHKPSLFLLPQLLQTLWHGSQLPGDPCRQHKPTISHSFCPGGIPCLCGCLVCVPWKVNAWELLPNGEKGPV